MKQPTKQTLPKGTRIKMPALRAEKVHKVQVVGGIGYTDEQLVYISSSNTLIYQYNTKERVVFKNCTEFTQASEDYAPDGILIYIQSDLFNVKNYIQL